MPQKLIRFGLIVYTLSSFTTISGMGAGVGIAILGLIAFIISQRKIIIGQENKSIVYLALLFLLSIIVSTIFSYDFASSSKRLIPLFSEAALFFIIISYEGTPDNKFLKTLINIIFIVAAIESVYGILQYFTGLNILGAGDIVQFGRIKGTLGHWNSLGGMLGIILPVFFSGILFSEKKSFFIAGSLIAGFCLVFTSTRGAWAGVLFALVVISFFKNRKLLLIPLILIILLMIIPKTRNRIIYDTLKTTDERVYIWKNSFNIIKERPIFGWGPDSFRKIISEKEKISFEHFHSHNIYLGLLQETGILGFGLFISIIFMTIKRTINIFKDSRNTWQKMIGLGLLGSLTDFLVHGLVDYPLRAETGYFFWFILGVIFALSRFI